MVWWMLFTGGNNPLGLPISLRVVTRRQTQAQGLAERLPNLQDKLGTSVGVDVRGDAVKAENVVNHVISRLPGRGQFG